MLQVEKSICPAGLWKENSRLDNKRLKNSRLENMRLKNSSLDLKNSSLQQKHQAKQILKSHEQLVVAQDFHHCRPKSGICASQTRVLLQGQKMQVNNSNYNELHSVTKGCAPTSCRA